MTSGDSWLHLNKEWELKPLWKLVLEQNANRLYCETVGSEEAKDLIVSSLIARAKPQHFNLGKEKEKKLKYIKNIKANRMAKHI